jgi:drug/metabolite transporter (DMT)-like permease
MRKQPTVVKDTFGEWPPLATMAANAVDWLSNPAVAATLALALALLWTAYASAQNKTAKGSVIQTFAKECGGMLLCVPCWLMPQFIHLPGYEQWIAAGVLLVLGDYLMGSPHVNPTVSYAFVVTGDVSTV